jgi:hypothetical protein
MRKTPHKEKLLAAMANPKCKDDVPVLNEALHAYQDWINKMNSLTSTDKQKVKEMTDLLNEYKDYLEVELIARRGSPFIKRQKGQLKLDNTVLAAECKVNYDKTMFQEGAGTASRLKQGCPISKYYVLVEYLDMEPEDCRLTDIDNVFLLRHAKRLPFQKRSSYEEVKNQHKDFPIDREVVYKFVEEIQAFIDAVWYDPAEALKRGSFV